MQSFPAHLVDISHGSLVNLMPRRYVLLLSGFLIAERCDVKLDIHLRTLGL